MPIDHPGKPTNFRSLLDYLWVNPYVMVHRPKRAPELRRFWKYENGLMWFRDPDDTEPPYTQTASHVPVNCGLKPAELHETGITFTPEMFTFTKFGVTLEFHYAAASSSTETETT
jgi:hypothetical protein